MNIQQVKEIARDRGLKPGRLNKKDLIRFIQKQEGNFDCYGSACAGECDQHACLWREDCLRIS